MKIKLNLIMMNYIYMLCSSTNEAVDNMTKVNKTTQETTQEITQEK